MPDEYIGGELVAGWRAWYANGAVYDSRLTTWAALPARGCEIVMFYLASELAPGRPYRHIVQAAAVYRYVDGDRAVFAEDDSNSPESIALVHPGADVKVGELLPDETFQLMLDTAMAAETW